MSTRETARPDPIDAFSAEEVLDIVSTPEPPVLRAKTDKRCLPEPVCLYDAPPAEPVRWLAQDFLLAREITLLVGDGGSYKSTTMLAIAAAVAGGYPVLGEFAVTAPASVLMVSEEDGQDVIVNRLEAFIAGMQWDRQLLRNVHLFALEGARLDDLAWQLHVSRKAEELGAELLCFDPLADLISQSEKDPDAARPVVQFWRKLTAEGAAVLALHHFGKPKEGYRRIDQVRGASSWAGAARAVYALEPRDGGLWLSCEKLSRAARPAARELALAIETEPDNRATWNSATLAVAHPTGSWQVTSRRDLAPSDRKALAALDRHRAEGGLSWSGWCEASGVGKSTLSEAKKRLQDLGYVLAEPVGKRAGKPVFAYSITGQGLAAYLESPGAGLLRALDSGDSGSTPAPTPAESPDSDSATPPPPVRGGESGGVDGGPGLGIPDSDSGTGPGLESTDEEYWEGLSGGDPGHQSEGHAA